MADAEPAAPDAGGRRPEFRGIKWATAHTGLGKRTVQRRASAWLAGDRSSYALRAALKNDYRGDRLVDPVDAERLRLQAAGRLDPSVTAERWDEMIAARDVPWLYVTDEQWFRDLVGPPPPS